LFAPVPVPRVSLDENVASNTVDYVILSEANPGGTIARVRGFFANAQKDNPGGFIRDARAE